LPQILIRGREALPEERTRSAMMMQKNAVAAGWTVKIGYSQARDDPRTFKTGEKAGLTEEGKLIDMVWCQGFKEGHVFTVTWENNKLANVLYDNYISNLKNLKEKL
jgi:hypothetical protein